MKSERVCFVAGHSGGHIVPCLTIAKQLKLQGATTLFFTSSKALDRTIIAESDAIDYHFSLPLSQQRAWYLFPFFALSLFYSFLRSFFYLLVHMPDRIISTGSVVAIPVCFAGYLLGIPIELFELNVQPGKTIQLLSHCTDTIFTCFKKTDDYFPHHHCVQRPYPVRFTTSIRTSFRLTQFKKERITLFVQGGSQGSLGINSALRTALEKNPHLTHQIQIIHQTGATDFDWKQFYAQQAIPAHLFSYESNLAPYYQSADIIICRSGAGALFETLFFKKQCITMPLETATNNHQLHNAQAMVEEHPALVTMVRTEEELIFSVLALCTKGNSVTASHSLYK